MYISMYVCKKRKKAETNSQESTCSLHTFWLARFTTGYASLCASHPILPSHVFLNWRSSVLDHKNCRPSVISSYRPPLHKNTYVTRIYWAHFSLPCGRTGRSSVSKINKPEARVDSHTSEWDVSIAFYWNAKAGLDGFNCLWICM